jgi:hypothetical protein
VGRMQRFYYVKAGGTYTIEPLGFIVLKEYISTLLLGKLMKYLKLTDFSA